MPRALALASILALAVAGLGAWWLWGSGARPDAVDPAGGAVGVRPEPGTPAQQPAARGPSVPQDERSGTRLDARPEQDHAAQDDLAPRARWIEGRTLDPLGGPLEGVEVLAVGAPEILAQSGGDGRFRLEAEVGRLSLHGRRPGFVTVYSAEVSAPDARHEALIVLAPAVELAGQVVDGEGLGLAGAVLRVAGDRPGLVGFPHSLEESFAHLPQARAGADGRFEFSAAPRLPGHGLFVDATGHRGVRLALPESTRLDLVIRLERDPAHLGQEPMVFGVVQLPDGTPAAGARVRLGSASTSTDRDGRFELGSHPAAEQYVPLAAMLAGWQPALWQAAPLPRGRAPEPIGPLVLTLPGPELAIAGRLARADGSAVEGWHARLLDATALDVTQHPIPVAENLGQAEMNISTGPDGRFRIAGLSARDYRLRLWDPGTFASVESGPVPAGSEDLHLVVPPDVLLERLAGRVVSQGGVPVEGAEVAVRFVEDRTRFGSHTRTLASATTDAHGSFEFGPVPSRNLVLAVRGEDLADVSLEPPGGAFGAAPVLIEVERLVRLRLDFSSLLPPPDAFRVLDPSGAPLALEVRSARRRSSSDVMSLAEGRSAVVTTRASAATLVLLRGTARPYEELSRRPIRLLPGEINLLGP